MNARDDEWHEETNCKLVGGPCDGGEFPMKRGWSEYVVKNHHIAMSENLGDSIGELKMKVDSGEIRSEEDIEQHFNEQRERSEQDGVKLSQGGHKYRRGKDDTTFTYVGPVSLDEVRHWSMKNIIPHQRIHADKAMWERIFGKYIDGNDSEGE